MLGNDEDAGESRVAVGRANVRSAKVRRTFDSSCNRLLLLEIAGFQEIINCALSVRSLVRPVGKAGIFFRQVLRALKTLDALPLASDVHRKVQRSEDRMAEASEDTHCGNCSTCSLLALANEVRRFQDFVLASLRPRCLTCCAILPSMLFRPQPSPCRSCLCIRFRKRRNRLKQKSDGARKIAACRYEHRPACSRWTA